MRLIRRTKALLFAAVLVMILSTTVFAASTPAAKTFGGANVVAQPDGKEIEYYQDFTGKTFFNLPFVIRTIIPGDNGNTIKYEVNHITNLNAAWLEHKIDGTGTYMTVSNVLRESEYDSFRFLYAKGPVKITFSASSYLNIRKISQFDRFAIENGKVLYNLPYDFRTNKAFTKELTNKITFEETAETLDKSGLYAIDFSNAVEKGVTVFVYITDGNEGVNYTAPKAETAKPASVKLKVDGKSYDAPAYSINGENYLRIRDIAYMLNGTAKQFGIAYVQGTGLITLKTFSYDSKYEPIGGEMKALAAGNKTASPSKQKMKLNNAEINPIVYTIGGSNFVKLRDIANIVDFGVAWDGTAGVIGIDTTVGYVKPGIK